MSFLGDGSSREVPVEPVTCAANARADLNLLRAGVSAARVGVLTNRAISIGVGVDRAAPFLRRAEGAGWPVVRRSSGGTAVLHRPGDLTWTLVLPRRDPRVGRDYARGYERLGRAASRFLGDLGFPTEWGPSPGLSDEYCLLGHRGSVLRVGGRVLGGAAQHLSAGALLHHGVLPATLDPRALESLFGLSPTTGRTLLTSLRDLGIAETPDRLAERLAEALHRELGPR